MQNRNDDREQIRTLLYCLPALDESFWGTSSWYHAWLTAGATARLGEGGTVLGARAAGEALFHG